VNGPMRGLTYGIGTSTLLFWGPLYLCPVTTFIVWTVVCLLLLAVRP
jgi:hypothetical protein